VILYKDPEGGGDYDAQTYPAVVDKDAGVVVPVK